MGDNLLNMVVKFTTMDGLSEPLKRMMGLGKSAKTALGDLQKEAKGLKGEMSGVSREMAKSASASMNMMERYKALDASIANVNRRIAQQKRLMAIDARTSKIQTQANAYKSAGMHGLMGAAMMAAPVMGIAHEVGDYQALQNKLTMLGLGKGAVNDLTAYSQAMNVAGSSAKDNLRYLVEAQGAFRESGEHSAAEQLRGAKTMAPLMAKMAATLKASGHEMSEDQERYFLRFVEQAGGTVDPRRAAALTDGLFRAIQSSGGTVDAAAYQGFLAKAGTAGMKLSARTMFADFEPLIAELHEGAGVGLQTAYSRANGIGVKGMAANEMMRIGLWDKSKVNLNSLGGIKSYKNGENPLRADAAALMKSDPVEFYRKFVLPAYQRRGVTDIERENKVLFGGTGGTLFNLINKQLPTILRSRDAYQKTQSLDQAYNTTKDSFFGQGGQLKAAAQDFVIAAGSKGGLLENMTGLLKGATGALRGLTNAANAHPGVFRFLTTAVVALIGMRVATAGAKLAFGGLLGPVGQLWGMWSKYKTMGTVVAAFPKLAQAFNLVRSAAIFMGQGAMRAGLMMLANPMVALIVGIGIAVAALAYVVYKNWGAISGYFTKHWARIRNLFLTGMVIFTPFLAALVWLGAKVYNNWDKISAVFSNAWERIKSGFSAGINWVKTTWTGFTTWLSGTALGKAVKWGGDIAAGAANGIKRFGGRAIDAAGTFADDVGGNFANQLQIRSPSRVFMAFGGHIANGLAIGLDRNSHHPVKSVRKMATAVAGAGALALAPAGHGRAPAAPRGGDHYEIHIHQLPGENADALAEKVMAAIARKKRAAGLGSYEDDF